MQVKRNQPTLFDQIQNWIVEQTPIDVWQEEERNHGRHSQWHVSVYNALGNPKTKEWKGLKRFIHVHKVSFSTKQGKTYHNDRFYISDLATTDANFYGKGIRGHWKIENSLHWVKDVIHKEDNNAIKKGNGPMNFSILSNIAINFHRSQNNWSITDAQVDSFANIRETLMKIRT